jgi:hypothetical protein
MIISNNKDQMNLKIKKIMRKKKRKVKINKSIELQIEGKVKGNP